MTKSGRISDFAMLEKLRLGITCCTSAEEAGGARISNCCEEDRVRFRAHDVREADSPRAQGAMPHHVLFARQFGWQLSCVGAGEFSRDALSPLLPR